MTVMCNDDIATRVVSVHRFTTAVKTGMSTHDDKLSEGLLIKRREL